MYHSPITVSHLGNIDDYDGAATHVIDRAIGWVTECYDVDGDEVYYFSEETDYAVIINKLMELTELFGDITLGEDH